MPHTQQQLDFDDWAPIREPEHVEGATIEERFASFHRLNPHVYLAIVAAAREKLRQGYRRVSMKLIYERLREASSISTRGDAWKLNNDYTALYARKAMDEHADLAELFQLRVRKSEVARG